MDNPNYRNIKHVNAKGEDVDMMLIVSRNQGWITVEPSTMDRKHPLEKKKLGDVTKVNVLSPIWMQVQHQKPGPDPLKSVSIIKNERSKADKTILVERQQPNRSIFNVRTQAGRVDQSAAARAEAIRTVSITTGKSNLIAWKENNDHKPQCKDICGKIGSAHFN